MKPLFRCAVLVAVAAGSSPIGLAQKAGVTPQALTLRTDDGVAIAAEMHPAASGRPAPGVILVHMLTRTHLDWQVLADRLSDAGLAVVAIDLRGHGASQAAPAPPADSADMNASVNDVKAARVFLTGRPDICSGRIGIAGAQVGANLAIAEAASDPLVRSVALLSPGIEFRLVRADSAMRRYDDSSRSDPGERGRHVCQPLRPRALDDGRGRPGPSNPERRGPRHRNARAAARSDWRACGLVSADAAMIARRA